MLHAFATPFGPLDACCPVCPPTAARPWTWNSWARGFSRVHAAT